MRTHTAFLLVTFLISSIIIFAWFSTKTFISNNSDENLSFINFTRSTEHHSTSWYPIGTGRLNVTDYVRYPYLQFLSFFEQMGFAGFLIQAFSYWLIMILGVIFMYFLLYRGFEFNKLVVAIGSFFYLLNIYTMTQVWKRNVYHGMFGWAYLPLFIFLWVKWLNEGKIVWLVFFALSMSIFSHSFAHPGYFFVYLATAGTYLFIKIWDSRKNKNQILSLSSRCVAAISVVIIINIWWIYPFYHNVSEKGSTLDIIQDEGKIHLDSLVGVSKYFGTFEILLLRQKAYFEKGSPLSTEWFDFYNSPFSIFLSLAILALVVVGILKEKKHKYFIYLFSLLIVGWFISKGSNFPLGYQFFDWLFSTFPFAAALRNPYEKFGIVWLLPYSTFFALGLYHLSSKINLKWRSLFIGSAVILFCGILVYPMWNGDIFPSKHRLTIPTYYIEANDYLNLNSSKRSFHIPFSLQAELLKYSWGYIGQDASENLFDTQNVSRSGIAVFSNYYELIPKFLSKDYLPKALGLLGVDHIILHYDMIYPPLDLNIVKIDQWKEIKKDREFGPLTLYRLDERIVKPEVFATTSVVEFDSIEEALNKISTGEFDTTKNVFVNDRMNLFSGGEDSLVSITYKQIPPNHFQVQVKNAESPFVLVLNHSYNNSWVARIDNQLIEKHFLVNGFANGWLIEKKGDYSIEVLLKIWPWE